jgi:hypothetical protein
MAFALWAILFGGHGAPLGGLVQGLAGGPVDAVLGGFGSGGQLQAQNLDAFAARLAVDNPTPLITEQVTVSILLEYRGRSLNLVNPSYDLEVPDFGEHFKVVKQGRRNAMDLSFGGPMKVFEYVFILQPLKEGPFTVDGAAVIFKDRRYATDPIDIKVLPASTPPEQATKENIFIDASLSRTKPWKGESMVITYKLYSRYELLNLSEESPPTFDGFSATNMSRNQERRIRVERFGNREYYTLELFRAELYPLRGGTQVIPQYKAKVLAAVPTGRKLRSYWGTQDEVKRQYIDLASPELRIPVRELPSNAPADFNGAVGRFDLDAELSGTETAAGEPLTLRLRISGDGNLKLIGDPKLNLPPAFEAYEPQIKSSGSAKTYEYLIIPGKPGNFTLEPFSFSYFDTRQGQYVRRSTPSWEIAVSPGEGLPISGGGVTLQGKESVEQLAQDIRYLQAELPPKGSGEEVLFTCAPYWVAWALPFALAPGLWWFGRRRRAALADVQGRRTRGARRMAEKRLKKARKLAASGERKAFYDELVHALWAYLGDRFGLESGQLNREGIRETLGQRGVPQEAVERCIALLDRSEMALYAPVDSGGPSADLETATGLLADIESALG